MVNRTQPQPPGTALITGGGRRVGAAIAQDLAAYGWKVAIHFNTGGDAAGALAAELVAAGHEAHAIGADLSDPAAVSGLVPATQEALGPVTLLVNNAAMFARDELGQLDRATFDAQLAVNLTAPVFLTEALAAGLPENTDGNVINILDQRVLKPLPVYVSYQLAKSALHTATRTMAQALAPRVRVNGIAPGPTLAHDRQPDAHFDNETAKVPLQRAASLEEFGRAVRFFVDMPSVTGQTIALDSGQHLAWETPDHAMID